MGAGRWGVCSSPVSTSSRSFTHSLLQFSFLLSAQRRSEWRPTRVTSAWRVKRIQSASKPIIGMLRQPPAARAHADARCYTCAQRLKDDSSSTSRRQNHLAWWEMLKAPVFTSPAFPENNILHINIMSLVSHWIPTQKLQTTILYFYGLLPFSENFCLNISLEAIEVRLLWRAAHSLGLLPNMWMVRQSLEIDSKFYFLVKDGKQNPENGDDLKVETRKRVVCILFLCKT